MKPYKTGSRQARVVEWFRECPDEELYSQDIATKFGGHPYQVAARLRPCVAAGLLSVRKEKRDKAGGVKFVYSAGPALCESNVNSKEAA